MTESEAIERIKEEICHGNPKGLCRDACMYGKGKCAYDMATRALEEIQQYRAIIGLTPEDLKALEKDEIQTIGNVLKAFAELEQYRAIGTVSEFRELKEKAEQIESLLRCHDNFDLSTSQKNYELVKAVRRILGIDWSEGKE